MKVKVIGILNNIHDRETKEYLGVNEERISNIQEIEFDPLNDEYAFSSDNKTRWLFLNRIWYRLSLKSFKECRKQKLV